MIEEVWRDIDGYDGLYQVSDQGRVKSLKRKDSLGRPVKERILRPAPTTMGYLAVVLCTSGNKKNWAVHRLVCQAFHENPDNKTDVNHINEDKTDNRARNLEWCTRRENINHGTHNERSAKNRSKPIGQYTLNGKLVKTWSSLTEVGRQTGFDLSHVSKVARGKYKQAYNFTWEYVEEV